MGDEGVLEYLMLTFSPQDEAKQVQFTVLTDRTQGGTSLNDGEVELMVGEGRRGCVVSR